LLEVDGDYMPSPPGKQKRLSSRRWNQSRQGPQRLPFCDDAKFALAREYGVEVAALTQSLACEAEHEASFRRLFNEIVGRERAQKLSKERCIDLLEDAVDAEPPMQLRDSYRTRLHDHAQGLMCQGAEVAATHVQRFDESFKHQLDERYRLQETQGQCVDFFLRFTWIVLGDIDPKLACVPVAPTAAT
jgi:hypothetical protein